MCDQCAKNIHTHLSHSGAGSKNVLIYASQGFAKRLRVPFKCSAPDRQPNIFDFSNILKQKI